MSVIRIEWPSSRLTYLERFLNSFKCVYPCDPRLSLTLGCPSL
jgi:hypothetical protein